MLIIEEGDLHNGADIVGTFQFGNRPGAFIIGAALSPSGRKNPAVSQVRGRAALLLLGHHLLLQVALLDDQDGFGRQAEGEVDLLLAFFFR